MESPFRKPLTKSAILEFQRLYEVEFGEALTYDQAAMRAREMVELYERLYLRDPKDFPKPEDHAARE